MGERVRQVARTELQVQEVTSPRSIARVTQQVVSNNQAVSAPVPSGSVAISQGTSHVNVGNVGNVVYGGSVGLPASNSVVVGHFFFFFFSWHSAARGHALLINPCSPH